MIDGHVKQLPNSVMIVWAFANSQLLATLSRSVSDTELVKIEALSHKVLDRWKKILNGECTEPHDILPSFGFLRHCGTPMADRYMSDIGITIKKELGAETYGCFIKGMTLRAQQQ
jgi:hypothetical protein